MKGEDYAKERGVVRDGWRYRWSDSGDGGVAVEIVADEIDGGGVTVWDKHNIFPLAVMGIGIGGGGEVSVGHIKSGLKASMTAHEQGGSVFMYGKESVSPLASMGVYKQKGVVSVGSNAGGSAMISTDEHGGVVAVSGKGSDIIRATTRVDKYGNGEVSTSDKNGHRLATLK